MSNTAGGCFQGFIATVVFVATALILTVAAYGYGALLGIAPEFPLILSGTFLAGLVCVITVSSVGGRLLGGSGFAEGRTAAAVAGAALMACLMTGVWLLTAPRAGLIDWPGALYFLQLVLPAIAAGTVIGLRGRLGETPAGMAARQALCLLVAFLVILAFVFLPLWQARRGFETEASQLAARYFQVPPGMSFGLTRQGAAGESFEANELFGAGGTSEDGGRTFSINVIGERHRFSIDIKEIHANVIDRGAISLSESDWKVLDSEPDRQYALLAVASSYSKVPLRITAVDPRASVFGSSVTMSGSGVVVTARPVRVRSLADAAANASETAIDYSFEVTERT